LSGHLKLQFDALDACHQQTIATLDLLVQLVDKLDQHAAEEPVRRVAREIIGFFNSESRAHHAEEEHLVFPPLLQGQDKHLADKVRRLKQDHAWLEQDWLELGLQLDAIARGYNWYDREALRKGTSSFVALYLDHIDLEESLIYPQARRRLAERTDARAARLQADVSRLRA
jgi:iron-sulfur cluster repair protein YtfE (RIC family)